MFFVDFISPLNMLYNSIWFFLNKKFVSVVGKLKTVSIDVVDKRRIRVSWRLDCSDRVGIVTGYKISYCPIESLDRAENCLENQILTHEAPADAEHAWIKDLEPWTTYKVLAWFYSFSLLFADSLWQFFCIVLRLFLFSITVISFVLTEKL
jgi:hypothetical protein